MIDVSRLLSTLNNTGLQRRDNSLYQFLKALIQSLGGITDELGIISAAIEAAASSATTTDQASALPDVEIIGASDNELLRSTSVTNVTNNSTIQQLFSDSDKETDVLAAPSTTVNFTIVNDVPMPLPDDNRETDILSSPASSIINVITPLVAESLIADDPYFDTNNIPFESASLRGFGAINAISKWISDHTIGVSTITDNGVLVTFSVPITGVTIDAAVSTFGNRIFYDGANTIFIGIPGTTSAKRFLVCDSGGNSLFVINGVGDIAINAKTVFDATGSISIPFDGATNSNDVNPGVATIARVTPSGGATGFATITGFSGGVAGRMIIIMNTEGTWFVQLSPEDAGSTAANRIAGATSRNIEISAGVILVYDGASSRWRICSTPTP